MSEEMAFQVIDRLDSGLADDDSICIHLYGGEPLTNPSAVEALLKRAAEKRPNRFSFSITTNGTCHSEYDINLLRKGNFSVILSIDGPEEIHDECRRTEDGAPTHSRVIQFLETLRSQTSCLVRGSAVVRSGWTLAQATAYLRTLPLDAIKAQAVRINSESPLSLTPQEKQAYLKDLEAIGHRVITELEAGRVPLDDRFTNRVLQLLTGERREAYCGAGESIFGITPSGQVRSCILIDSEDSLLGHIDNDPELWIQAGLKWKTSRPRRTECKTCSYLSLCGGGCPAIIPVCGSDECDLIRKTCEVAVKIHDHFQFCPEILLATVGIT